MFIDSVKPALYIILHFYIEKIGDSLSVGEKLSLKQRKKIIKKMKPFLWKYSNTNDIVY